MTFGGGFASYRTQVLANAQLDKCNAWNPCTRQVLYLQFRQNFGTISAVPAELRKNGETSNWTQMDSNYRRDAIAKMASD